jgi:hypothetical protein
VRIKASDYNVYLSWVTFAVLGDMSQADGIFSTYPTEVRRTARKLRAKLGVPDEPLYRGVLLEPELVSSGPVPAHRPGEQISFSSWSTSRDVACYFADRGSVMAGAVMMLRPRVRGYVLKIDQAVKSKVLWHYSWADRLPSPDGKHQTNLFNLVGPSLHILARAIHGQPQPPEYVAHQLAWNLRTQREVILQADPKIKAKFVSRSDFGCPGEGSLDERFTSPVFRNPGEDEVFDLDLDGDMGLQSSRLWALYKRGEVSLDKVETDLVFMEILADPRGPDGRLVMRLRAEVDKAKGKTAFLEEVRGARAVHASVDQGRGEVMIHKAVRPDAPEDSYQVTRFGLVGPNMLPFGHHYSKSMEEAVEELWRDHRGPRLIERRNPMESGRGYRSLWDKLRMSEDPERLLTLATNASFFGNEEAARFFQEAGESQRQILYGSAQEAMGNLLGAGPTRLWAIDCAERVAHLTIRPEETRGALQVGRDYVSDPSVSFGDLEVAATGVHYQTYQYARVDAPYLAAYSAWWALALDGWYDRANMPGNLWYPAGMSAERARGAIYSPGPDRIAERTEATLRGAQDDERYWQELRAADYLWAEAMRGVRVE